MSKNYTKEPSYWCLDAFFKNLTATMSSRIVVEPPSNHPSLIFSARLHLIFFLFYSYDLRGRGPEKARHWSDDHVLGKSRAMFFMAPPASQESLLSVLKIRGIQDSDRGLYRCRVDFKAAPTRNTKANLTVIGNCH